MEAPLTTSCPLCGGEMEPRGRARRGRAVYTCIECGHETIVDADEETDDAGDDRDS